MDKFPVLDKDEEFLLPETERTYRLNQRGWIFNQPERKKRVKLNDYTGYEDLYNQFQSPENKKIGGQGTVRQRVDDYQGLGPGKIVMMDKTNAGDGIYFYPDDVEFDRAAAKSMQGWNTFFESPSYLAPLVPMVGGSKAMLRLRQFKNEGYYQVGSYKKIPFADEFTGTTINMNPIDRSAIDVKATSGTNVKGAIPAEGSTYGSLLRDFPWLTQNKGGLATNLAGYNIPGAVSANTSQAYMMTQPSKVGRVQGVGTITAPFILPKGNTLAAREARLALKENYSAWIRNEMEKPGIVRPEDIDRRGRLIRTPDGESLSMQGVKKVWSAIKGGETDAEIAAKTGKDAYITFGATNPESKGVRVKKMQPPVEEATSTLVESRPDLTPEKVSEIIKAWNKASKHGYASTAETARWEGLTYAQRREELKLKSEGVKKYKTPVSEKTRPQLAAGHGRSVMSRVDHYTKPKGYEGRLYDAPTDAQSVRLEDAIENIKHGNKPEGDINFYAAKLAGWPTTWKESLEQFVDKYLGEYKLPDWRRDLNSAQVEKILKIPSNWSEAKVEVYWEKYIKPLESKGDIKTLWEIRSDRIKGIE